MANKVDLNSKYLMNMFKVFCTECVAIILFAQLGYSVYYSVVCNQGLLDLDGRNSQKYLHRTWADF